MYVYKYIYIHKYDNYKYNDTCNDKYIYIYIHMYSYLKSLIHETINYKGNGLIIDYISFIFIVDDFLKSSTYFLKLNGVYLLYLKILPFIRRESLSEILAPL